MSGHITGVDVPINMEQKVYELAGCMTLTFYVYVIDLGF